MSNFNKRPQSHVVTLAILLWDAIRVASYGLMRALKHHQSASLFA